MHCGVVLERFLCFGKVQAFTDDRAGTGDHGFERRMRLGGPLLEKNIATMVLER